MTRSAAGRRYTGPGVYESEYAAALVDCLTMARKFGAMRGEDLPLAAVRLEDDMQKAIRARLGITYMVPSNPD